MDDHEDEIRSLAHEMWMKAGCPDGMELAFWVAAEGTLMERKRQEAPREQVESSGSLETAASARAS